MKHKTKHIEWLYTFVLPKYSSEQYFPTVIANKNTYGTLYNKLDVVTIFLYKVISAWELEIFSF